MEEVKPVFEKHGFKLLVMTANQAVFRWYSYKRMHWQTVFVHRKPDGDIAIQHHSGHSYNSARGRTNFITKSFLVDSWETSEEKLESVLNEVLPVVKNVKPQRLHGRHAVLCRHTG